MGVLGIRNRNEQKVNFLDSMNYARDNKEDDLHRLVSSNPMLVVLEQDGGERLPTITIGDKWRLPSGELDILLFDIMGNVIIVEFKRDRTPRDAIAQILDYASDLHQMSLDDLEKLIKKHTNYEGYASIIAKLQEDNPEYEDIDMDDVKDQVSKCLLGKNLQLLIVSYNVDERIKRVAEFLRNSYGMKIYCVEFDYFENKDQEYFIPKIIGTEEVKKIERRDLTPIEQSYKDFYAELLSRINERKEGMTNREAPASAYCVITNVGSPGIHLEWAFHGRGHRNAFEVGLHFEKFSVQENEKIFNYLKNMKDELCREFEETELKFQFPWGTRWARIYAIKPEGEMTEDLKDWAIKTALRFHAVFKPRLDEFLSQQML